MTPIPMIEGCSLYDAHATYYVNVVDEILAQEGGLWWMIREVFDVRLADRLGGADLLDVTCGEAIRWRLKKTCSGKPACHRISQVETQPERTSRFLCLRTSAENQAVALCWPLWRSTVPQR